MDFPETPEAVALRLLEMVLEREDAEEPRRNDRRKGTALLDLYTECLAATSGDRQRAGATLH